MYKDTTSKIILATCSLIIGAGTLIPIAEKRYSTLTRASIKEKSAKSIKKAKGNTHNLIIKIESPLATDKVRVKPEKSKSNKSTHKSSKNYEGERVFLVREARATKTSKICKVVKYGLYAGIVYMLYQYFFTDKLTYDRLRGHGGNVGLIPKQAGGLDMESDLFAGFAAGENGGIGIVVDNDVDVDIVVGNDAGMSLRQHVDELAAHNSWGMPKITKINPSHAGISNFSHISMLARLKGISEPEITRFCVYVQRLEWAVNENMLSQDCLDVFIQENGRLLLPWDRREEHFCAQAWSNISSPQRLSDRVRMYDERRRQQQASEQRQEEARRQQEAENQRIEQEEARRQQEAENQRIEQEEARRQQEAENQRRREEEAENQRIEQEEARRQQEAERQRIEHERARRQQEAENQRIEQQRARREEEAERQRIEQEEARREQEAERQRIEQERARREEEAENQRIEQEEARRQQEAERQRIEQEEARRQQEAERQRRADLQQARRRLNAALAQARQRIESEVIEEIARRNRQEEPFELPQQIDVRQMERDAELVENLLQNQQAQQHQAQRVNVVDGVADQPVRQGRAARLQPVIEGMYRMDARANSGNGHGGPRREGNDTDPRAVRSKSGHKALRSPIDMDAFSGAASAFAKGVKTLKPISEESVYELAKKNSKWLSFKNSLSSRDIDMAYFFSETPPGSVEFEKLAGDWMYSSGVWNDALEESAEQLTQEAVQKGLYDTGAKAFFKNAASKAFTGMAFSGAADYTFAAVGTTYRCLSGKNERFSKARGFKESTKVFCQEVYKDAPPAKKVLKKAAYSTAGSAIGCAVGSIVPVIGNGIGAFVGGFIGGWWGS